MRADSDTLASRYESTRPPASCVAARPRSLRRAAPRRAIASKKSSSPRRAPRSSCASFPAASPSCRARDVALVGSTHHAEIMNRAPGTMIQRNSGEESLTAIRSPVLTGPGSCGVFLFLENSIPIRPTGFCNVNELFEVNSEQASSIEVLRGPAGVVYGSGAMHGAVNVIQAAPAELPAPEPRARSRARTSSIAASSRSRTPASTTDLGGVVIATHDGGWRDNAGLDEQKLNLGAVASPGRRRRSACSLAATNLNQETAGFIQGFDSYRDEAHREVERESRGLSRRLRDAADRRVRAAARRRAARRSARSCATRAWTSCSTSSSASRSRRTARTRSACSRRCRRSCSTTCRCWPASTSSSPTASSRRRRTDRRPTARRPRMRFARRASTTTTTCRARSPRSTARSSSRSRSAGS